MTSLRNKKKYGEVILETDENTFRIFCDLCTDTFLTLENFRYHIFKHLNSESSEDSTDSFLDFIFKDDDSSYSGENLTKLEINPIAAIEINPTGNIKAEQLNIKREENELDDKNVINNTSIGEIINGRGESVKTGNFVDSYKLKNIPVVTIYEKNDDDADSVTHFDNLEEKKNYDYAVIRRKLKDIFILYNDYCPICSHTYANVGCLISHTKIHLKNYTKEQIIHIYKTSINNKCLDAKEKVEKLKCSDCEKTFIHDNDLQRHVRIAHLQKLKCSYCRRTFVYNSDLERHVKLAHLQKLSCKFCDAVFDNSSNFIGHMLDIHSIDDPFECDLCPQKFKKFTFLTRHLRFHNNDKRYECEHCGKRFMENSQRKLHVRQHHTHEKLYQCDECGRTFNSTSEFKLHKLRHSNKREYKCTKCDKKFYHQSGLRNHFVTHTKEKRYECNICHAKFGMTGALWTHKRLHSNERNYKCKICDKSFVQSAGLHCHMKTHGSKEK